MADAAYGSLPFAEQVAFFRRKLNLPTDGWTDVYTKEHDWAFVVAGANRDALVADFRQAVEKAISEGTTLETFRKDFDKIVAKHGWDYNGGRNWRSRVIYDTNLASSYAAGRYEQLQAAPYWQYEHADWVTNPRHDHLSWDGKVLARDDPWWQTHYPPNGWGCQCTVRGLWQRDLDRLGKDGPDETPEVKLLEREIGQRSALGPRRVRVPEGIDPGFEYAPGAARLKGAMPPERPDPPVPGSAGGNGLPNRQPNDALPPPQAVPAEVLLPEGLAPQAYAAAFLEPLGATVEEPAIFEDVIGERMVVGAALFQDAQGDWKPVTQGPWLALLARAVAEPDEIWARVEWVETAQRAVVRRRYMGRYVVDGREVLAVFELGADGWTAIAGELQDAEAWRVGARLYQRQ